ncbi:MAG: hypothetical protein NTW19_10465 [Planctomycetota bacterium]|nr:hypothetical protein [Planctomycetota bacterium]
MTGGQSVFISCPSCAAKYRWKDELAGKKIKCAKCQAILRMPLEPTGGAAVIHKVGEDSPHPPAPTHPPASTAKPVAKTAAIPASPKAPPPVVEEPDPPRSSGVDAYDIDDGEEPAPASAPAAAPPAAPKPTPKPPAPAPSKPAPAKPPAAKPAAKPDLDQSIGLAGDVSLPPPPPAKKGADKAAEPGATARCPSCGNAIKPEAVICLNCGFNIKAGAKVETTVEAGGGEGDGEDEPAPVGFKAKMLALIQKFKKAPKNKAVASAASPETTGNVKSKPASASKKKPADTADAKKAEK